MKRLRFETIYFDLDNVIVDISSVYDCLDEATLKRYQGHFARIPGIFAKIGADSETIAAIHELSESYDLFIVSSPAYENPAAWNDKIEWVEKHLGPRFVSHLLLCPNACPLWGNYLITSNQNDCARAFGGERIFLNTTAFPDWEHVLDYLMPERKIHFNVKHLEVPISVITDITLLKESWNANAEHTLLYDFDEDDLRILSMNFSEFGPKDDISEALEEHLSWVADYIHNRVINFAKSQTLFTGEPEDILHDLFEYHLYSPMEIISHDIKKGNFLPSTPNWEQMPEEELIYEWCRFRYKDFYKKPYSTLSDFFEKEYQIDYDFVFSVNYEIRLPQELYDVIQNPIVI